jgi:hypothetical protein
MARPHQTIIPIGSTRPDDIIFMLVAGAAVEFIVRFISFRARVIPSHEQKLRIKLKVLRHEIAHKRQLGPSAFVETSKLERQLLSLEKELNQMDEARKERVKQREKIAKKFSNGMNIVIFLLYYGVQLFTLNGFQLALLSENKYSPERAAATEFENALAASFLKRLLFPLSFVGLGIKISRLGLPQKASSIGALVVYWCGQTLMAKLLMSLEAIFVQSLNY